MTNKKPMTVDEVAKKACRDIGRGDWCYCYRDETFTEPPTPCHPCTIKQAILTFAAQEAEPLVEALKKIRDFPNNYPTVADKAIKAHRAKYPRKP